MESGSPLRFDIRKKASRGRRRHLALGGKRQNGEKGAAASWASSDQSRPNCTDRSTAQSQPPLAVPIEAERM